MQHRGLPHRNADDQKKAYINIPFRKTNISHK